MYVSSLSSRYSPPFLHLSDVMIPNTMLPLLCKPKSHIQIKRDLLDSQNPITFSTFWSEKYLSGFSCGCNSTNNVISFTIEDVITCCGLPEEFVVRCKSSENPISVFNLLRNCGFSQTQLKTIFSKYPRILFCNAEKTLKPKIDFLSSVGLSKTELRDVVTTCPLLFRRSLNNHLVPYVDFLITSLGCQHHALGVIKRYPFILYNTSKYLAPNLSTLRNLGIPQSQISNMMAYSICSRIMTCTKPCKFSKVVSTLMEMGFDPLSSAFGQAVNAMLFCTESSAWEGKLMFYKTLGFSDDEILNMFRMIPTLMSWSEKAIRGTVEFYVNKFHWSPSQLSRKGVILSYSLENRIIPRCLVLQLLLSRNRICRNVKLITVLKSEEEVFLQKYVIKYKDETPEVLDAYQDGFYTANHLGVEDECPDHLFFECTYMLGRFVGIFWRRITDALLCLTEEMAWATSRGHDSHCLQAILGCSYPPPVVKREELHCIPVSMHRSKSV
ncbi:hypothetical protein Vadar_002531 [Vaccinium darrowii]|uniref:Uncharacterized protein n=1 Tax=Vaccinium darrowii TaxID=229202 RepID=A0ACB7X7P1_9ERIC|nr:hypothetical protein Vadar_002531 [Vaccinium darrowii]